MVLRNTKALAGDERDRRISDLRPRTVEALYELRKRTGTTEGSVFRRKDGSPYPSVELFGSEMNTVIRTIVKELEIPDADRITLHVLRHTSASWHYLVDTNLIRVKDRGAWLTLKSVERYVHHLSQSLAGAVRRFFRLARS